MERFNVIAIGVAAGIASAPLGTSARAVDVSVRSDRGRMPDGSAVVLPGESLWDRIEIDSPHPCRLLAVTQDDVSGGPAVAWAAVQVGAMKETVPVRYWVHPWTVATPAAGVVDVTLGDVGPDGSTSAVVTIAHRTPRPLSEMNLGSLAVTFSDPVSGRSAHFDSSLAKDAKGDAVPLTDIVNCIAVTTFTGEFPPGWPLDAMLADADGPTPLMLVSGWGADGATGAPYQILGFGQGTVEPSAIADLADALAGWIAQGITAPEPDPCAWPPFPPPSPPPCQWQIVPTPANPPSSASIDAGQRSSMWWHGAWTHQAKAGLGGTNGAKSQWMEAHLAPSVGNWAPGLPCFGSWNGTFVFNRTGDCPSGCPCEAVASISARLKIQGKLDATCLGFLDAALHVVHQASSKFVSVSDSAAYAADADDITVNGSLPPGVELVIAANDNQSFVRNVPPTPPLLALVRCGDYFAVDSLYACSTNTSLGFSSSYSSIGLDWNASFSAQLAPTAAAMPCDPQPILLPWSGP